MVSNDETKAKLKRSGNAVKKYLSKFENSNKFLFSVLFLFYCVFYLSLQPPVGPGLSLYEFLTSEPFKIVTTVLIFPVFALFVNNTFKVRERIDAQLEKRKEERKQLQLDCFNNTQAVWRDILGLCGELKFYDSKKSDIADIRLNLVKFRNTAIEVINMWKYYFPKLHEYDENYRRLLLVPFDILLNSANSVAQYMYDNQGNLYLKNDKIVEYQCALNTIEDNMDYFFHKPIINIFKSYMDIEHENDISAEKRLNDNLGTVRELSYNLKEKEMENEDISSFVEDKYKYKIENISDKYKQWCKYNPTEKPDKCYLIKDFNKTFDQKDKKRKYTTKIPYSLDCMNALATYLDSKRASEELKHKALWQIGYYLKESNDNDR